MYVCIYVCMYIRMYVCMHVHMCIACICVQMRRKGYEQRYWRASRVDIVARDFMRGYIDRLSSCFFERDSLIICLDIGAGEDFFFLSCWRTCLAVCLCEHMRAEQTGCSLSSVRAHIRAYVCVEASEKNKN
jgi:hypothetical protein